jgi:hypothetical protein
MANDTIILGEKPVAKSHSGTLVPEDAPQFESAGVAAKAALPATITTITKKAHARSRTAGRRRSSSSKKQAKGVIDFRKFIPEDRKQSHTEITQDDNFKLMLAHQALVEATKKYKEIRDTILGRLLKDAPVEPGILQLKLGVHIELDGKKLP